ncbi:MAG: hypothetical protein H6711_34880 [Myxococcales bacterium]|nr:hypothetical protein [Myxococcales bacterium]
MLKITSMNLRALPLAVGAALLALGSGCKQPKLNCTTAHGYYAAAYELKSGDANSPCGSLPGDILGMQTYYATGGLNGTPRYDEASIAIRVDSVDQQLFFALTYPDEADDPSLLADPDALHYGLNALGDFTAGLPDDADFCMVPELDASAVKLPAIAEKPAVEDDPMTPDVDETDEGHPAQDARDVRYEWSNARFLVSANAQGTQFEADLKYSENGCTAEYHVTALYPVVGCESDDECNDDASGINPDFAVKCDSNLGLCVLSDTLPSYE